MNNDQRQMIMSAVSAEQHERYRQILTSALPTWMVNTRDGAGCME